MQLVNFTALTLFASSAFAATCFGNQQKGIDQFQAAYWDAREKMCGNSACGYQQSCATQGSKTIKGLINLTVNVSLDRKNTGSKKGFKDCWAATENIIDHCVRNNQQMSGTWEANGQLYQMNGWYS
ncbi:hypothetical protein FAVG1_10620 [Fusarium avenaceum]|nr:hypothetical protein FAVG1_10620 [Fusarium avenaceum]